MRNIRPVKSTLDIRKYSFRQRGGFKIGYDEFVKSARLGAR